MLRLVRVIYQQDILCDLRVTNEGVSIRLGSRGPNIKLSNVRVSADARRAECISMQLLPHATGSENWQMMLPLVVTVHQVRLESRRRVRANQESFQRLVNGVALIRDGTSVGRTLVTMTLASACQRAVGEVRLSLY
jgi:hypothetical protein